MTSDTIFPCTICNQPANNPYLSLDRRVEKVAVGSSGSKPTTTMHIEVCQTMFVYCTPACWQKHLPAVAAELKLKMTFPQFALTTPCSRCGTAVTRTKPYVSYALTESNLEQTGLSLTGYCIDDVEFAILCPDCEEPDMPGAEAELEEFNIKQGAAV